MPGAEQIPNLMSVENLMPKYRCHKKVRAAKIAKVEGRELVLVVHGPTVYTLRCPVTEAFIAKHNPVAGGYYVVYEDGYRSFSPAATFEGRYTREG
jgi:hypothetical protein